MSIFQHHPTYEVSAKVALYSHDKARVLIMRYASVAEGLPGGHLEPNETPDEAVAREFYEELGATLPPVKRKDFFRRETRKGPVILGYVGIAPEDFRLQPPRPHFETGVWVTPQELEETGIAAEYRAFILANWPQ